MANKDSPAPPRARGVVRRVTQSRGHVASTATTGTPQLSAEVAVRPDLAAWRDVLSVVRAKRPALASILEHAALLRFDPECVELGYEASSFLVGQATDASASELLLSALATYFEEAPALVFATISARSGHLTALMVDAPADPLRESLQRARRVAPQLAAATDAVNDALECVEQALATLNLGVTASVNLDPNPSARDDWQQYLRFGKDGSAWRLMLESGPDSGDAEDWSQSPLLSASKEVRVGAVERLPALVDKLVEVAEEQVGRFRAAASKAQALAAAIAEAK